jgi:hypothetical protein
MRALCARADAAGACYLCDIAGTVYRGEWQGIECAVKVVVFRGSCAKTRRTALREAAIAQSISHPNIIATYLVGGRAACRRDLLAA